MAGITLHESSMANEVEVVVRYAKGFDAQGFTNELAGALRAQGFVAEVTRLTYASYIDTSAPLALVRSLLRARGVANV